jgi:hypothetical protein
MPSSATDHLQQVLAIGFLLVILSCALFHQYLPLLVVATYVLAPLPNWICGRCANPDDFVESSGSAIVDFGRFATGFLVLMGIGRLSFLSGGTELCDRLCWNSGMAGLFLALGTCADRVVYSSSGSPRSFGTYLLGSGYYVNHRWTSYLWNHHHLRDVLPGGA